MIARLKFWWRALRHRRAFERDLDDELAFHLAARTDDLVAQGLSAPDASRQARIELGMAELHRDDCRRARGIAWIDTLQRDLRYALRGLLRNPGYSITALLVLATAVAANAVLFGLFNAYALSQPPLARAERWVTLASYNDEHRRLDRWTAADADALLRDPPPMFEGLYWLRDARLPVQADVARSAFGEAVSDNYFELLGIRADRGRLFSAHDAADDAPGVVLSALGWRLLMAADPDVVGRDIDIAGRRFRVVGVAQHDFTGVTLASALFWLRERDLRAMRPDEFDGSYRVDVGGFLRDGATVEEAEAALTARVLAANADRSPDMQLSAGRIDRRSGYLRPTDLEELVMIGTPVGLAFASLLLVASANLANLVLARFAARRRELAVRAAVGASRLRMVVQLLAESVLLAALASVLGFALAAASIGPLHAGVFGMLGDIGMELRDIGVDLRVFGYAAGLALLAALVFGGVPAWLATAPWRHGLGAQPDLASLQRPGHLRLRSLLMVAQFGASVVLLVLASLIASNARRAEQVALGFDPARVIAVQTDLATPRLASELALLPQVEAVSAIARTPLMGDPRAVDARIGERSKALQLRPVDARYFDVLDVPVLRGRSFTRSEESGHARVAVISRRTAERLWPDADPLGRSIDLPAQDILSPERVGRYTVVGVVEDVVSGLFVNGVDRSAVYLPTSLADPGTRTLLVRVHDDSRATRDALARTCVAAAAEHDCEPLPMAFALRLQHVPFLMAARITGALGWVALAISCLGLYGLTSYLVLQKRREIGVRLALGATSGRIVRGVLRQSARQVGAGLLVGLPIAFGTMVLAQSAIASLRVVDPVAFVGVPMLLVALALLAAWIPARRIARVPATDALRDE